MTSSDREILIAINDRVARLEDTVAVIAQQVDALDRRMTRIEDKVDSLQDSVYWGFAVIAFVVALLGVFVPRYAYHAVPVQVQESEKVKA